MKRWPIFVSYALGVASMGSVWLGDQVLRTPEPQGAAVCWIMALMLMLGCMVFAQQDGHRHD